MSLWIALPIALILYGLFILLLGQFIHAGGATRDVRDD